MSTATREICAKTSVNPVHASTRLLCVVAAIVAVVGLWMHFVGLEKKVAWFDEAVTLQIIAGVPDSVFKEKVLTRDQLLNALQLTSENSGLDSSVRIISTKYPDQGPIWLLLAKGWALVFGNNLVSLRTFAALFSVVAAPLFYWLILEFAQSRRAAVIGLVLMAVSPFMMLYSAEARYYTCWVAILICNGIAFLRLGKNQNIRNAILCGVLLAAASLMHLATLLMVPGAILFLLSCRIRFKLICAVLVPLMMVPAWFLFIGLSTSSFYDRTTVIHFSAVPVPLDFWLSQAKLNLARVFVDSGENLPESIAWIGSSLSVLFLLGSFVLKETTNRQRAFLLFLLSSPLIFLGLDVVLHGMRAVILRYQAILVVAIYLAAAFWFDKMFKQRLKLMRITAGFILVILVSYGLLSSVRIADKAEPWNKSQFLELPAAIKWSESKNHPLFVIKRSEIALAIVWMLSPQSRILVSDLKNVNVPSDTDGILLCDPFSKDGEMNFEALKKEFPDIEVTILRPKS